MTPREDEVHYPLPELSTPADEPSYAAVMDWMKSTRGRRVTFDFWARGNYMRRLLRNRANNVAPLLVRVKNPREMSWAYKRLALLDVPVEFVYAGKCEKAKVLHLCPADIKLDAGWGYVSALGSRTTIGDRSFFPIIGNAKLMPEPVIDWLLDEASEAFMEGKVFVAPAELIGIDANAAPTELTKHSELSGGTSISPRFAEAQTIMELNMPFVDKLSSDDYRKLLKDHADHLVSFRKAFHNYVSARVENEAKGKEVLHRLCAEIEELTKSDKHIRFRDVIGALGGILGLTSAVVAATSGETSAILAASGAIMTGGKSAIVVHEHLREKARITKARIGASPYALFWELGMTKPGKFKPVRQVQLGPAPTQSPSDFYANADYHWLCPPTAGILQAAVRTSP